MVSFEPQNFSARSFKRISKNCTRLNVLLYKLHKRWMKGETCDSNLIGGLCPLCVCVHIWYLLKQSPSCAQLSLSASSSSWRSVCTAVCVSTALSASVCRDRAGSVLCCRSDVWSKEARRRRWASLRRCRRLWACGLMHLFACQLTAVYASNCRRQQRALANRSSLLNVIYPTKKKFVVFWLDSCEFVSDMAETRGEGAQGGPYFHKENKIQPRRGGQAGKAAFLENNRCF